MFVYSYIVSFSSCLVCSIMMDKISVSCPCVFSESILCQLGYKSKFLKKMSLNFALALAIFRILEINRIKDNIVSTRYISINFDRNLNRKKS